MSFTIPLTSETVIESPQTMSILTFDKACRNVAYIGLPLPP